MCCAHLLWIIQGAIAGMSKLNSVITELNSLLNCNIESLEFNELKKLVRKRHLQWHPDKNPDDPDLFKDKWITLFKCWKYYEKHLSGNRESTSSDETDFENLFSDSEVYSDEEMDYNGTPFSDEFFQPSPTKDFKIPPCHNAFIRSRSNRRAGKFFAIYCLDSDREKLKNLNSKYNCLCDYFGIFCFRSESKNLSMLLLHTLNEYRIHDIKKNCKNANLNYFKVDYLVKFKSFINFCVEKYGEPVYEPCNNSRGQAKKTVTQPFNNNLLVNYAVQYQISNVLTLMSKYSHLAKPCNLENQDNAHEDDHREHLENAISFIHLSDRRRACQNAVNCVQAELYEQIKMQTPWRFLDEKVKEYSDKLYDITDCKLFGEAYLYSNILFPKFKSVSLIIINTITEGKPRKRWTILQGPYKSGKTSFAAAFCKFLEGCTININVDKNRLSFFLGNAIGKRFVLFDDVKGRGNCDLTSGFGFKNLDDLRDHLDGHTEVQLEKKNQQPIEQKFPPGIITCNEYVIEPAILERVNGPIQIRPNPLFATHEMVVVPETIFIGLVLHNILPVESYMMRIITERVQEWKDKHRKTCDCLDKVSMGAALGTLFAVAGTLLVEALTYAPTIVAVASQFFLDFGATTAATAFSAAIGAGGALVETASYLYGGYLAVNALQGGLLGIAAYLGAGQLVTTGILGLAASAVLFGGGAAVGWAIGSGNSHLLPKADLRDFLYSSDFPNSSSRKPLSLDDIFFGGQGGNRLFAPDPDLNDVSSGVPTAAVYRQRMRIQSGAARKQTMFNYGSKSLLPGRNRSADGVEYGSPKGRQIFC